MREIDDVYMSPPKGNFLVAELNVRHLAVRMFESAAGIRHPENISPDEAADEIKTRSPDVYETVIAQAHVALEYFEECMRGAKPERHQ